MMKVSLAEFVGGKEADDAYNKLCELTGLEWDAVMTCRLIRNEWGTPLTDQYITYDCSECGYTVCKTNKFVTFTLPNYCPNCGCRVID